MNNVGKMEHIISIIEKYEKSIKEAETEYNIQLKFYMFSTLDGDNEEPPKGPCIHNIETQATTALERIKGYLNE